MFTKAEVMLTGSFAETVRRRQVRREQPLFRRMHSPAGSTDGIGDNDLSPTAGHREAAAIFRLRSLPGGIAGIGGSFPQRQGIGDNDLSPTASSMEPFAGGKCEIYTHTGQIKIEIK